MIEVEFRLPTQAYAYINVRVSGETELAVNEELTKLRLGLMSSITRTYDKAVAIVNGDDTPDETAEDIAPDVTPAKSAEELIKSELGGTVIEVTDTPKPWERAKPTTASSIADF